MNKILIYIIIFFAKLLDSFLSTQQKISINKGNKNSATILAFITKGTGLTLMTQVIANKDFIGVLIMCISYAIGIYISMTFSEKREGEKEFLYIITPKYKEDAKVFTDILRENNMFPNVKSVYRKKGKKSLEITIITNTKEQSKIIKENMPKETDWKRITTGVSSNYFLGNEE